MEDLEQFRLDTREWLTANCPDSQRQPITPEQQYWGGRKGSFPSEDAQTWFERMRDKGWTAPEWPTPYGGGGLSPQQGRVLKEEMKRIHARTPLFGLGLWMLGPAVLEYGSEEQKQQHIRAIVNGEHRWCQGYSEPGAGSDLASLQCKAEDKGDHFLVNGSKIWTTAADRCDWIFCLVRTDPDVKKQEGISFLLIDMKTPGITVKPIVTIDGKHSLNEVLFEDCVVPAENLIGEQDKGWTYAKALLAHERTGMAEVADSTRMLEALKQRASVEVNGGKAMIEDPIFQMRLSDIEMELMALEYTELRVFASMAAGGMPGPESSLLKIKGTEISQAIHELQLQLASYYGGALPDDLNAEQLRHDFAFEARGKYMYGRAATIYGGSNEVQRNVIAKAVLGL